MNVRVCKSCYDDMIKKWDVSGAVIPLCDRCFKEIRRAGYFKKADLVIHEAPPGQARILVHNDTGKIEVKKSDD